MDLPAELLDQIFSYLHLPPRWDRGQDPSRRDLCACRLVNHLWADAAYNHTFSAVAFDIAVSDSSLAADPKRLLTLAGVRDVLTSSPRLCQAIESLSLLSDPTVPQRDLDVSALYAILVILPRLRYICLKEICQRFKSVPRIQHEFRLHVDRIEVPVGLNLCAGSAEDLLHLTDMFEDIGELSLPGLWLVKMGDNLSGRGGTRIRHIDYPGSMYNELSKVLHNFEIDHLKSLTICPSRIWIQPKAWSRFCELLRTIGSQLVHLGVHFGGRMEMYIGAICDYFSPRGSNG